MAWNRRSFLMGTATAAAATMLPRIARAAGGPKILIVGGSAMTGALGIALEDQLGKAGYTPHRKAKGSSGLARPDFFDWVKEAKRLYEVQKPAGTVVMFGGNDGQGLWMGKNADPPWIRYGEAGWDDEYRKRIRAFAKAVCQNGEHIFWLGMPIMRAPKLKRRVSHMNDLFRGEMAVLKNSHYIDTWDLLADGNGNFQETMRIDGKVKHIRAPDGVHLGRAGAILMAEHTIPVVRSAIAPSS